MHRLLLSGMARGSVFRKNGRWAFRVDAGVNPETGKRRQMLRQGFKTQREAEKALAATQQAVEQNSVVAKSTMKVDAFFDEWLASQNGRLKESTLHSYEITAKRIRGGLGHVQLQALTPLQIERFYADLLEHGRADGTGLSPKTVRNTHTVLRKALSDAERLGLVQRNAAAAARGPAVERPEFTVWSSDELNQFFAQVESHRLYAAFVLLATTGMRRGEVLGVRWSDIDLDSGELAIVQTITSVDGRLTVTTPKTRGSRRVIYLDDTTVGVLRAHRKRQREEQLAAGPDWDNTNGLLFTDETGAAVRPEWFSKEFGRHVAEADVPRIRLHDVRHTYATLALKASVHPKIVSERLGHSTIAITLDLYSHVTPGVAREAAQTVAAKIFGP
ncbi:MAG: site-specific integrase [Actinomycetota bacterium]